MDENQTHTYTARLGDLVITASVSRVEIVPHVQWVANFQPHFCRVSITAHTDSIQIGEVYTAEYAIDAYNEKNARYCAWHLITNALSKSIS